MVVALKSRDAEGDLVDWCTGNEEGNVLLMNELHPEGE